MVTAGLAGLAQDCDRGREPGAARALRSPRSPADAGLSVIARVKHTVKSISPGLRDSNRSTHRVEGGASVALTYDSSLLVQSRGSREMCGPKCQTHNIGWIVPSRSSSRSYFIGTPSRWASRDEAFCAHGAETRSLILEVIRWRSPCSVGSWPDCSLSLASELWARSGPWSRRGRHPRVQNPNSRLR